MSMMWINDVKDNLLDLATGNRIFIRRDGPETAQVNFSTMDEFNICLYEGSLDQCKSFLWRLHVYLISQSAGLAKHFIQDLSAEDLDR